MIRHLFIMTVILMCVNVASAEALHPAQELVIKTADKMVSVLQTEKEQIMEHPERIYELVEEYVLPHFDFERMSRLVLGKNWRKANSDEQKRFIEEFRMLLVRTYATAMSEYSDQVITYLPFRSEEGATEVVVKTEVEQKSGFPIPIDYDLYLKDGVWKVYNVSIDDVSLVMNYRSSFASEIRALGGVDGLIAKLHARNQQVMND